MCVHCKHACMFAQMYASVWVSTCVCTCMTLRKWVWVCVQLCACMRIWVHAQVSVHKHGSCASHLMHPPLLVLPVLQLDRHCIIGWY